MMLSQVQKARWLDSYTVLSEIAGTRRDKIRLYRDADFDAMMTLIIRTTFNMHCP